MPSLSSSATLSTVTYATGEVGKAFSFNGANGWAALGDPGSLAFTQSFTIEGWIKVNGFPTNSNFGSIMFRGDDRGGLDPYTLAVLPNGDLRFDINGYPTGDTSVEASVADPDNLSAFASVRDTDGALTVMVINKQQGSTPVTLSLANFSTSGTAQAWQINSTSQANIARLTDLNAASSSGGSSRPGR